MICLLIVITGKLGSGKTLLATLLALKASQASYKIRANYQIKDVNFINLRAEDLFNIKREKNLLVMDEGYTWLEARISMSKLNRYMSYVLFQSRKRNVHIIITAQIFDTIDVRYRDMVDLLIRSKWNKNTHYFIYTIYKIKEKGQAKTFKQVKTFQISFEKAKLLFDRYDSYEVVMTDKIQDSVIDVMDRQTILNATKKYVEKMLKIRKIWSLKRVKGYLYTHELSLEYADAIYYQMQLKGNTPEPIGSNDEKEIGFESNSLKFPK